MEPAAGYETGDGAEEVVGGGGRNSDTSSFGGSVIKVPRDTCGTNRREE